MFLTALLGTRLLQIVIMMEAQSALILMVAGLLTPPLVAASLTAMRLTAL
ncbi:Uncharacterised protein [uncultured archaeon]|nr:Uncharacterised protein [uncultured archaeon]